MAARKYSRVQEKGQITVPIDIRKRLDIKKGDLVAFEERDEGVLIIPFTDDIQEMDALLRSHGMTFQDLIDQMRDERPEVLESKDGNEIYAQNE